MANAIIIILLVVFLAIGIRAAVKHFKGEGSCCGGGSDVKVKRKHLKHVIRRRIYHVEGMHCEHCKNRIESTLNTWDDVSARVDLKKKTVLVEMQQDISDDKIVKAIEHAGYEVTGWE